MSDPSNLSRRERQIMDIIYANEGATVLQIQDRLPDAPSGMAIRRMLSILEEKRYVKRRKLGREYLYLAREGRLKAGRTALQHVLDTFFEGSVEKALATHLDKPNARITKDEYERLARLIDESRKSGN